jgi:AraC-like DNA-binding protein
MKTGKHFLEISPMLRMTKIGIEALEQAYAARCSGSAALAEHFGHGSWGGQRSNIAFRGTVSRMRSRDLILAADGFLVAEVACEGGSRGWSAEEPVTGLAIVLVRSGLFRRRVNGVDLVVDPMVAYLERPGTVQQIAHPIEGDLCTVIVPPSETLDRLTEAPGRLLNHLVVPVDVDVHHRALLARYRQGADTFELVERTTTLAERLLTGFFVEAPKASTTPSSRRSGILANQVRELLGIQAEPGSDRGLLELALAIGVSPYHLSRSFRHATGMTLTRYRRQLRIKHALHRLAEGDNDLARLAADLGFSDQSHFTRVTRLEAGATPGQLRALLSPHG